MNPGPAPTLLSEWVTADAFWAFIALAAFAVVVYMAAEFIKRMRTHDEQPAPHVAPQPSECQITGCHQPATTLFALEGQVTGIFYTCTTCAPKVRDWAGPYDRTVDAIYNQELDTVEDYANGEAS